jgi:hypothetical protein
MKKNIPQASYPYEDTPSLHEFSGAPDSCEELVNQFGTYEVQKTADTGNAYPAVAQGLPKNVKAAEALRSEPDE